MTGYGFVSHALLGALASTLLLGCRSEPDRSAMAQVTSSDGAAGDPAKSLRASTSSVRVQRLWTSGYRTFKFSSISPDGRFLSMVDWSTIDLAVRDLHTGELHRLTEAERLPGSPYEDAGVSIFSADGRQILYAWQVAPDVQLRAMDFAIDEEGPPRPRDPTVVFHNPEFEPYFPFDWSPDGSRILAKVWMGGAESHTHSVNHLAFISPVDGHYQALKSFDWREPIRAAFSPDGRYVAYDFPPEQDSPNRDLFVVSEDGAFEAVIVDGPASDRLLDWHPDGSILFHSDRGGSPGVWRLPMADGRPDGDPELLRADMWGVEPLGSTPGRFYYGIEVDPPRLYTAPLDRETGTLVSTPAPVADPTEFQVQGWDWSPDGDYLAFSAAAPSTAGSVLGSSGSAVGITTSDSESVIGISTSDGTLVKVLPLDLEATGLLQWDPDGESVVLFTVDSKARPGFYRVDLESGLAESLLAADQVERTVRGYFALPARGSTVLLTVIDERLGPDGWLALISRDLDSGEERDLGVVSWPGRIALSPDGSKVAAVVRDPADGRARIGTIPVEGGPATALHDWPEGSYPVDLTWEADGRGILFFSQRQGSDRMGDVRLWRGRLDGAPAREIRLVEDVDPRALRLHPDGRRVAFMAGEARGEVWVMDWLEGADSTVDPGGPS